MEYRRMGKTGLKVSELCLGTMQFGWTADKPLSLRILNSAFEAGINFIDTADIYSTWVNGNPGGVAETIIGEWMKTSNIARNKMILATKVRGRMGPSPNDEGLSRAHIVNAVEGSLRRLGTDYIDLYQAHWFDENTPILETLSAFDDLIKAGKVRYIGCSNYPAWRLTESIKTAELYRLHRYDCLQPHYSLVHRDEFERELADACRTYNLGVIPYSPLGGGFLTGKYTKDQAPDSKRAKSARKYFSERNWNLLDQMKSIADMKSCSISQIALAWLLKDELVTSPIIGPRSITQLEDNLNAVKINLTNEELGILNEASDWRHSEN